MGSKEMQAGWPTVNNDTDLSVNAKLKAVLYAYHFALSQV